MVVSCQQLRMARVFGKVTHWLSSSRLGNSVAGLLFTMGLAFGEPPKLILLVRSLDQTEVCNRLMPDSTTCFQSSTIDCRARGPASGHRDSSRAERGYAARIERTRVQAPWIAACSAKR